MFAKIDVNGDATRPLYAWLKDAQPGLLGSTAIKWNFTKFLVDRTGAVTARYAPTTRPAELEGAIEKLLQGERSS
jgi:glutathione peroxidase